MWNKLVTERVAEREWKNRISRMATKRRVRIACDSIPNGRRSQEDPENAELGVVKQALAYYYYEEEITVWKDLWIFFFFWIRDFVHQRVTQLARSLMEQRSVPDLSLWTHNI